MVFLILHRHYTGFGKVRLALIPQDDGEEGELRFAGPVGYLQHRIYRPQGSHKYIGIPLHTIDIDKCEFYESEARILDVHDYEYWFRFSSEEDTRIFSRLLQHKIDQCDEGDFEDNEEDYWEEGPWTLHENGSGPEECTCSCHAQTRYAPASPNYRSRSRF